MIYSHKVQYYETDKMQFTHHSNYIRFMEEARSYFLTNIGYSYKKMEDEGLISPVVKINIDYKKPTTYDDVIDIDVKLKELSLVTVKFEYVMTSNGETVCIAESEHCFLNSAGRPISLKKVKPEIYNFLLSKKE